MSVRKKINLDSYLTQYTKVRDATQTYNMKSKTIKASKK